MPELPTLAEAGFPAATFSLWQVLLAPSTMPAALIATINRAFVKAITDPAIHQRIVDLGAERIVANSPEEAQRYFAAEMAKWTDILGTHDTRRG